jgi:bifunctional N-acetylglucosamine-1-phosphate-uridyltransferase/glucosamine-1-phosphate-acetyltransferase GlmU-like protein
MFEFKGKPMIECVVELALKVDSEIIIPIVGHQKQTVIDFISKRFADKKDCIEFAHQDEQLGTGHALMQTRGILELFDGDVLILSGDVPLLKAETVMKFLNYHYGNSFQASLLSAIFENPFGYGRVIRKEDGTFIETIEEKDATDEQRKIKEINSGIYIVDSVLLFEALMTLKTDNVQGEYYLTDIFKYFRDKKIKIGAVPVENNIEITGINTVEQLEELEKLID